MKRIPDAFRFAKDGRVLQGTLAIADLERLQDMLADVGLAEELTFRLQGSQDEHGKCLLRLEVRGILPLACQRCLAAVLFDLDVDSFLELLPENADMSQDELENDTRDFLPVAGELDVAELVEDEILLALPVAPRHEKCGFPGAADVGERNNPFAALSALKGKPN